ncbi:MAG: endonuclease/exonuclease/phosphatase family protein [Moraxellaceae bacterium]|nr:endonuclease/exonuclease/phosphatase family protein [Moraxellaceae bacterium]
MQTLNVCTYNIHKGFSQFNRRLMVHQLRERLRTLNPDILFLQEVQGQHSRHALRHSDWPAHGQHEFLAEDNWQAAYGHNAVYGHGHHGNAVLSRFPIAAAANHDVSLTRLERRGLLHCQLNLNDTIVHGICVHLSLTESQRRRQLELLAEHVERNIPRDEPLIIAGDFNDWRVHASDWLAERLNLHEAFTEFDEQPARSFPSSLPVLRLDRIYLRGLRVRDAQVHSGPRWAKLSDHAPLTAELELIA